MTVIGKKKSTSISCLNLPQQTMLHADTMLQHRFHLKKHKLLMGFLRTLLNAKTKIVNISLVSLIFTIKSKDKPPVGYTT